MLASTASASWESPRFTLIGVGVTKFDEMVADRRMPAPKQIGGRKVWDVLELSVAFDAIPHADEGEENPWDEVL